MSEQPITDARNAWQSGNASLFGQTLDRLARNNPGILPDSAVALAASGQADNPTAVAQVQQANAQTAYQQYVQELQQQAEQAAHDQEAGSSWFQSLIGAAIGNPQAAQAATELGSVVQDKANEWADTNAVGGGLRSVSSLGFQALQAIPQVLQNAINYNITRPEDRQPGVGVSDFFSNTDVARSVQYAVTGDPTLDPGQDWFGAAPDSPAAQLKKRIDSQLAGNPESVDPNTVDITLGQRALGSLGQTKGTAVYTIGSGLIDGAVNLATDPSMYIGGGEVAAGLKGGKAAISATEARALNVGAKIADASASKAALEARLAKMDVADSQYAGLKALLSEQDDRLAQARANIDTLTPKQQELRDAAAAATQQHLTAQARQAEVLRETSLADIRGRQLDLDVRKSQLVAEQRREIGRADRAVARAGEARDAGVARGTAKPLPDGLTIEPARTVNIKPTAREARTAEPEGLPSYQHVPEGSEGSASVHRVQVHDADGNVVGAMFWNPESGLIEHVVVDAAHRRQGLATQMFHAAQDAAERHGWKMPKHATHPDDLTEAGAGFAGSHPLRPSELEGLEGSAREAAEHSEFLRGLYKGERSTLTSEQKSLADRLAIAEGRDVDTAATAAEKAGGKAGKLDRKLAEQRAADISRLDREREATLQQIADALEQRNVTKESALEVGRLAAERAGLEAPTTPQGARDLVRDLVGMRKGFSDDDVLDAEKFIQTLGGKDVDGFLDGLAALDNFAAIWDLTRGKFGVGLTRKITDSSTRDEVRAALLEATKTGDLDTATGNLRSLRGAARDALGGSDLNSEHLIGAYEKAIGKKLARVRYARGLAQRNVPWAASRNIEDADGMTTLVSDMASFALRMHRPDRALDEANIAFRDKWMDTMSKATTGMERREVYYRFLDDLTEKELRRQGGWSDDDIATILKKSKASLASATRQTDYTAEMRAAANGQPVTLNGIEQDQHLAAIEAELSQHVFPPDWDKFRRTLKSAKEARRVLNDAEPTPYGRFQESVIDGLFNNYWRTSVLAFRVSYVLRNMGDIQVRMLGNGHPSLFTSPHGLISAVMSHKYPGGANNKLGELIHKAERADIDVTGARFDKVPGEDADIVEAMDPYMQQAAKTISALDPGSPMAQQEMRRLGFTSVDSASPHFHQGWANELGMLHYGPMSRDVLGVITGQMPRRVADWARKSGITDKRDALVDYYWSSPAGRRYLDRDVIGGSTYLKQAITDRTALREYLFGDGVSSLESRWTRLSDGLNPEILSAVKRQINPNLTKRYLAGEDLSKKEMRLATDHRYALTDALRKLYPDSRLTERRAAGNWGVEQVRVPQSVVVPGKGGIGPLANRATDWFFNNSGAWENALGYLPEWKYAYWDHAARLIRALSPEDAATVVARAQKSLGGGLPGSWSDRTLRQVKEAAAAAKGNGDFGVDDLNTVSHMHAARNNERLFYQAHRRNAVAHQLRFISPFAQAWLNSMRIWGKLALKKSNRFYTATRLYQAGQGPNTALFSDDPTNPDDALFYSDQKSGRMMLGIPIANKAIGALASITSGHGLDLTDSVSEAMSGQSLNLLFQNDVLPPLGGPVLSIPAAYLSGTNAFQHLPDPIKQALVPYTNVDPDRDTSVLQQLTPAWASKILGAFGVGDFSDSTKKYIPAAMATLFSKYPQRYMNSDGLMYADGQQRLLDDATALSRSLSGWTGVLQNVSPGTPIPNLLVHDKSGETLAAPTLTQEFYDVVAETGSREQAMNQLVDKYGIEAVMTLLPSKQYGYTPTSAAYQYALNNPDSADTYARVLPLYFPGGGYSADMDRWMRVRGSNPAIDPDEQVKYGNSLLREAQLSELDRKFTKGEINEDEYDNLTKAVSDAYKNVPTPDIGNNQGPALDEARRALSDPAIANTEAGHAAAIYFYLRDKAIANANGGSLSGQDDAELRAWLRGKGEQLVNDFPEFKVMWTKMFKNEVSE